MRSPRIRTWVVAVVLVLGGATAGGAGALALGFGPFASATPVAEGPVPTFVDDTMVSGLEHTYAGPFEYSVGGGVAVLDCDDDGRPDVYLAGGAGPAALFHNESTTGGALRFSRLPDATTDLAGVNGAYPIDVDGDGAGDLIVLREGENVALRGLGGCRFERANEAWGLDGGEASTQAFSATWEPGSAWPTVAFGNYVDPSGEGDPSTWCQANMLLRPDGRRFGSPLPLTPSWCALSMLFSDWDGSGRMDLRVSNDLHYYPADLGEEQLWRIEPGVAPRLYTGDEGWARVQIQGMGIASYDVTGDGLPEVYLTSQNASKLQTLAVGPDQPRYRDIGLAYGVNVAQPFAGGEHLPSTAWHPEFADVNNDGFTDLFVSKGNVTDQPDFAQRDPSNLLLARPDGTFHEVADLAGILSFARGRGAALADLNADGMLDLLEVNYGDPVKLWRNAGTGSGPAPAAIGHWVAIRLRQAPPNVDAIGAVVEVRIGDAIVRREVTVGGGHAGGQLGWIHVGLGRADGADVRVTWPGGEAGPWQHVPADQRMLVERGQEAEPWTPSSR